MLTTLMTQQFIFSIYLILIYDYARYAFKLVMRIDAHDARYHHKLKIIDLYENFQEVIIWTFKNFLLYFGKTHVEEKKLKMSLS